MEDSTAGGADPNGDQARAPRCSSRAAVQTSRAFFDYATALSPDAMAQLSTPDRTRLIVAVIVAYRLSFPVEACPDYNAAFDLVCGSDFGALAKHIETLSPPTVVNARGGIESWGFVPPQLARDNALPLDAMMQVSETYTGIAEKITGQRIHLPQNPKSEIVDILRSKYDLID